MANVEIEVDNIAEMLYGIKTISDGMNFEVFDLALNGVLSENPELSAEKNAKNFLSLHYTTIAGAFRMIAAATGIICDALTNDDLFITGGDGK